MDVEAVLAVVVGRGRERDLVGDNASHRDEDHEARIQWYKTFISLRLRKE